MAFPFVALNMAYRHRYVEQSSRVLKIHVEDPPANADETQDKIRAGGQSFLERARQIGRCVLRRADAFRAERPGDVDAWLHYQVEHGNGAPALFTTGSCDESHCPDLLGRLAGRIYVYNEDSVDLREDATRRYQASNDYSLLVQEFPQELLVLYIKEVLAPSFGAKNHWRMYEFAKISRLDTFAHVRHMRRKASEEASPRNGRR